ncbi:HAMP domain-containing protein [Pseudoduganella violaceinigra]|uniref:HAMP domain-containing protein n=1 Tax=Pseudoduganella violaceinigra TaxID=246602 RepID=UPI0004137301|nr:cache domain-containing protein [Pseudoduganella violaceinigra]
MKLSFNIFQKVLITLLAVTLVPLFALWYLGNSSAEKELTTKISENLVSTMNTVATGVNSWDDTNLRAMRQATRLDDMMSMNGARQTPILTATLATYEWSYLLHVLGPDGRDVSRSDNSPMDNYGDRSYFKAVMSGKDIGRTVAIGKTSGKPSLNLGVPIRNENRTVVGVLAMAMDLGMVSSTVTDIRIGETGRAILLDADKKVIAHGDPSKVKTALQDFSKHPALQVPGITDEPKVYMDGDMKMVGFVRTLPQGWTVLVEQQYDEAFFAMHKMRNEARILILIVIALVAAVAVVMGKQLTRPINELTNIADKLSKGQLDVTMSQTKRSDEIGSLARAIERLGVSIQMAMDRLRKK